MLYMAFENVLREDITISYVVSKRPKKLFKYLTNNLKFKIEISDNGIHYVKGDSLPIQIIEQKQLLDEDNLFLKSLHILETGTNFQNTPKNMMI